MVNILIAIVSNRYDFIEENRKAVRTKLKLKLVCEAIELRIFFNKIIKALGCYKIETLINKQKPNIEHEHYFYSIKKRSKMGGEMDLDLDINQKAIYDKIQDTKKSLNKIQKEDLDEPIEFVMESMSRIVNGMAK